MRSKIYSSDFMRTSSKGQLWIPVFLSLALLMAFPVVELLMMGSWFGMGYEQRQIEMLYERLWKHGFMLSGYIVAVLAGMINGINGFWYLFSSKKVDFYHSLPVTKKEMFQQKTYMGVWYYLAPYAVFMFMAICIGAMRGFFSLKLMGLAGKMLLIHLVLYFLIYFFTVLAICVTGNILMGFLTLSGVLFYGPALGALLWMYIEVFYHTGYGGYGLQKYLLEYGSPLAFGLKVLDAYSNGEGELIFFILCLLTVGAALLAYTAYIKRKAESTGKSMAYRWVSIVVKFVVTIPCGLGCGLIFYMMPEENSRIPWWIFGMVIGTVLTHGVIEILYRMDFRAFFSSKIHLAISCILVAFCAIVFQFDIFHFDSYIPARENLAYINVDIEALNDGKEYFSYVKETENGKYKIYQWDTPESALGRNGKGFDKDIYEVLSEIVKKQRDNRQGDIQLPLKYTLESGRTVFREYQLTRQEVRDFLLACYEEGNLLEQKYSFLDISPEYLEWFSCTYYNGSAYSLFQNEPVKYKEFLDAFRKDIEEADAEELVEQPCLKLYIQYEGLPMEGKENILEVDSSNFYYASLYVYPSFERTIEILKETGYPVSVKDLSYSTVEMRYYSENSENSFTIEYEDQDQIEKVMNVLIPTDLLTVWDEEDEEIIVICRDEEGQEELYGYIPKNMVPDFMEKDIMDYEENSTSG